MGINGPNMVWVGVSQGIMGVLEVKVASTLKGLCEETGVSYGTATGKKADGGFLIVGKDFVSWYFVRREVRRVTGRGNLGGKW
jgi:hypothetical protein